MSLLTIFWQYVKGIFVSSTRGTKWVPFVWAARLHSLRQGSNNVGNTQQNQVRLKALATAEANSNANWARWRPTLPYQLQVDVKLVPGYKPPAGTND